MERLPINPALEAFAYHLRRLSRSHDLGVAVRPSHDVRTDLTPPRYDVDRRRLDEERTWQPDIANRSVSTGITAAGPADITGLRQVTR